MLRSSIAILLFIVSIALNAQMISIHSYASIETETPPAPTFREVAWYNFEYNGSDSTGNGNTLNISFENYNATYYQQGSYSLTQTGSYDIYTPDLNLSGDMSFSCWVRPTSNSVNNQDLVWNNQTTGLVFELDMSGADVDYYGNSVLIADDNNIVYIDTWYHIVITYDGTTGLGKIYINSTDVTLNQVSETGINLDGAWWMMETVNGYIDDARFYDFVLTQTNVTFLYGNQGVALPADE